MSLKAFCCSFFAASLLCLNLLENFQDLFCLALLLLGLQFYLSHFNFHFFSHQNQVRVQLPVHKLLNMRNALL